MRERTRLRVEAVTGADLDVGIGTHRVSSGVAPADTRWVFFPGAHPPADITATALPSAGRAAVRTPVRTLPSMPVIVADSISRIRRPLSQVDPQVVVGPSSDAGGACAACRLEQHVDDPPDVPLGEASMLLRREPLQRAGAPLSDLPPEPGR